MMKALIVAFASSPLFAVSAGTCVSVKTWQEFTRAVREKDSVTFCPFSITKPETESPLVVNNAKILTCSDAKRCAIRGPGNHISVRGSAAQLTLYGFSFAGATKSAIHVLKSSHKTHVIRRCIFRDNYSINGGAIRTGSNTKIKVFSTQFRGNNARAGGAIAHNGELLRIQTSVFKDNKARRGAGIVLFASATIALKKVNFVGNTATETPSGAISASSANSLDMIVDVTASDNGDCNGAYYRSENQCETFESMSCASEGRSCKDNAGCCKGLLCSDKTKTCEKEEEKEPPYSYSGSGCNLKGPRPTASNTVMKFVALGDTPYDEEVKEAPFEGDEYKCLKDRILPGVKKLAGSADFIVHVGDIKKGGSQFARFCNDQVYRSRRDLFELTEPDVDFLIVVGDNEWNECTHYHPDPRVNDPAKVMWRNHFAKGKFADFGRVLPYGGSVKLERQPGYSENFFFYYREQEIAFFGITEPMNEDRYDPINADWISVKLSSKRPKAVVIFAHSKLSSRVLSILPGVPTLHIAGNTHAYCMQKGQKPFLLEVTVDAFQASPLLISIVKDVYNGHFFHVEKTPYGC